jgi:formamidopyrimidine-DNA glycosylase
MFELPEFTTLARQVNETLQGKTIQDASLGNSPHKFVWYNRTPEEYAALARGKSVGKTYVRGRWMFVPLEPGYIQLFGECGGRILYHPSSAGLPKKYHLWIQFEDGSFLTATTQMWGAYELYNAGDELQREYVRGMLPTPVDPEFTFAYFDTLVEKVSSPKKRSVKSLLTQEQTIPGLGNAIAQDIMFRARLHPRHDLAELDAEQRLALYSAIMDTVQQVIELGGRSDEVDLFGNPGGYVRLMDASAAGSPCPNCGTIVEKIAYLGGACYLCPNCQV